MVRKDHLLTALTQDIRGDDVELQLAAYADTEEGFITEAELERFGTAITSMERCPTRNEHSVRLGR
jgi:hypothetical protein